jgi:serine/threonine protein kinase
LVIANSGRAFTLSLRDVSARIVIWSGTQLRIHGIEPPAIEDNQVAFSITTRTDPVRWVFICASIHHVRRWIDLLRAAGCVMGDFSAFFNIDHVLGTGGASVVYSAAVMRGMVKASDPRVAVKCSGQEHGVRQLKVESTILLSLHHPNVISAHGLYDVHINGERCLALILDHLDGGVVSDYIPLDTGVPEGEAHHLFSQILSAVEYIHSMGIVHRDIKMTNVLCKEVCHEVKVILSDFGLAAFVTDAEEMSRRCGSPGYIAPEMLSSLQYGTLVDCFSLGVVLYQLITGLSPFRRDDVRETVAQNLAAVLPLEPLDGLSMAVQDLVLRLCARDPGERISAAHAMDHDWVIATEQAGWSLRKRRNPWSAGPTSRLTTPRYRRVSLPTRISLFVF